MPAARIPIHAAVLIVVTFAALAHAETGPESSSAGQTDADTPTAATAGTPGEPTFEDDVVPILRTTCFRCHGEKLRKSGLDLRRRFTMAAGGESGPAIVPGKPDESPLIEMVESGLMPPEGNKPLDEEQVALLRRWVASGAPTRSAEERPLDDAEHAVEVTSEERDFWAFQPPIRPAVPAVQARDRVETPIDAFLLEKLEARGAGFSPNAPRRILIRRLWFDLTGLPPSPEDVRDFLSDPRPDAYERVVDRLLATTQFGERWARHWLDVAGYADSDGYLAADRLRPEAWRYRDYVIDALNCDKPYDRFVLEQVAGDELVDWRRAPTLTDDMQDALVATGFMRTAADPTYDDYKEKHECHKVMADTIEILSSAFLGLTVKCARCHAHKFDPIPIRDYYRMHAVLASSYDPDRWIVSAARNIPLATDAERAEIEKVDGEIDARVAALKQEIATQAAPFRNRLADEVVATVAQQGGAVDAAVLDELRAALIVLPDERNARQKELAAQHAAGTKTDDASLAARFPEFKADWDRLTAAIESEESHKQAVVQIRGLMDLGDPPAAQHVLLRGEFTMPGDEVQPGPLSVLTVPGSQLDVIPGFQTSGRRLALARWLVSPNHPLTARVFVNRVWHHYFGRGIVETLDNFGHTGARPTHPELLDWLATEFIRSGWSQKHLHRLIVTSRAYRQSSVPDEKGRTVDPQNRLWGWWPGRRHEGEVVRDAVLAVSGKLNSAMYGPPLPVSQDGQGLVTVADDKPSRRRSVYLQVRRSQPVTMLELFDTPRMEVNCICRNQSIAVTQSLATLHGEFFENAARALALRLLAEVPGDVASRLDLACELCFGRPPSNGERTAMLAFLDAVMTEDVTPDTAEPAGAEAAVHADNADARETLAWTQLALVLLNSNAFMFVQ